MSAGDKGYAYLVLSALQEFFDENVAGVSYVSPNPPEIGDIMVQEKNHGTGTHTFKQEDGPLVWTISAVYVATGVFDAEGILKWDFGALQLLNLIMAGQHTDDIVRKTVHEFADNLKADLESYLSPDVFDGMEFDKVVTQIDTTEKNLWRKH